MYTCNIQLHHWASFITELSVGRSSSTETGELGPWDSPAAGFIQRAANVNGALLLGNP